MSLNTHRYYIPSHAAPITGIFTTLTVGSLAGLVCGALYALLAYYNPLAYFTGIGAFFVGAVVGLSVEYGSRNGRVRNRRVILLVCAIASLLTVYLLWVVYIALLTGAFVIRPRHVWTILQLFAANGIWEIGGHTPVGWELYGIWLAEAGVIVWGASSIIYKKLFPFCEHCQRWTEEQEFDVCIASEHRDQLIEVLEAEKYREILEMAQTPVHDNDCIHLTSHKCPTCDESSFLSSWRTVTTINDQGEEVTHATTLFEYMIVPHEVLEGLASLESTPVATAVEGANSFAANMAVDTEVVDEDHGRGDE